MDYPSKPASCVQCCAPCLLAPLSHICWLLFISQDSVHVLSPACWPPSISQDCPCTVSRACSLLFTHLFGLSSYVKPPFHLIHVALSHCVTVALCHCHCGWCACSPASTRLCATCAARLWPIAQSVVSLVPARPLPPPQFLAPGSPRLLVLAPLGRRQVWGVALLLETAEFRQHRRGAYRGYDVVYSVQ